MCSRPLTVPACVVECVNQGDPMKLSAPLMMVAATLSLSQFASGAVIGQIDTFQNGTTDGWFAGGLGTGAVPAIPPQVVANGGPQGTGDQYLRVTGVGGVGP